MQRGRPSRPEAEDAWHDGTTHLVMSLEFMQYGRAGATVSFAAVVSSPVNVADGSAIAAML
jgi:hypothetical protein